MYRPTADTVSDSGDVRLGGCGLVNVTADSVVTNDQ